MLLRNQNIVWPLLDYTDYSGSLVKFDFKLLCDLKDLRSDKIQNSTRFIHPDEQLLFWILNNILKVGKKDQLQDSPFPFYSSSSAFDRVYSEDDIHSSAEKNVFNEVIDSLGIKLTNNSSELKTPSPKNCSKAIHTLDFQFPNVKQINPDKLCVGIANVKVKKDRFDRCMKACTPPLDDFEKQNELFSLINTAAENPKCDLIVFPEVYIPFAWLPFMALQSRRHQIGFVFGLEHVNVGKNSLNLVATLLPFKDPKGFSKLYISLRLKNYYSPVEALELKRFSLQRPDLPFLYEKFHWQGAVFTVFNCFELTDIVHRGLFRSDIDMLIAVEYNKDINYYSNILESVTRDVHCFAIQANTLTCSPKNVPREMLVA